MFLLRCVFVHDRNSSLVKAGVSMLRQAVFIGLLFPPSVATRSLPPQAGEGILCQASSYTTGIRRLSKRVCRYFVKRCLLGFYSPLPSLRDTFPRKRGEGILCQASSYTTGIRRLSKRVCRCFVKRYLLGFYSPLPSLRDTFPASGGRDFVPGGHRCLHLSKVVKMAVKTKETSCFLAGEPRLGFVVQVASCVLRGKHTRGEGVSAE